MRFIEMSGKVLLQVLADEEPSPDRLREMGVQDDSLVRVNLQGDIELRQRHSWEVIGGLLGDFEHRVRRETGLDWA